MWSSRPLGRWGRRPRLFRQRPTSQRETSPAGARTPTSPSSALTDQRSQVSFNFGRTNEGFASPVQTFIESSIGSTAATLQFGASATMTATITPAACNTAAPNCYPTGTGRFIVDGGNPGSPVGVVGATNNNQPQFNNCVVITYQPPPNQNLPMVTDCGTSIFTVSVVSNTIAIAFPTGSVNFYAGSTLLGSSQVKRIRSG